MFKNYELTLDIATGDARHPLIQVNTNDLDSFKISFIITQHKEPVDLTGKTIRIAILKPDRKTVLQDCALTDAENGKGEVILDTQAYALGGKHYAEVMVYDGAEKVAVTGRFVYNANRGILNDGTVESTNEWQSINQAIADAENILIDLRENGTGVDAQARQDLETVTAQLAQSMLYAGNSNFNEGLNIFAHRGLQVVAPENTIPSIVEAKEYGMRGVEIDIRTTSDGVLILHHNLDVDKMTDGTGNVPDFTLAQIKELNIDIGNNIAKYPNLKIPTLEEALQVIKDLDLYVMIHIYAADPLAVLKLVEQYNLTTKTIISSTELSVLQEIRTVNKLILLSYIRSTYDIAWVNSAVELGNCYLGLAGNVVTFENVKEMHDMGIRVIVDSCYNLQQFYDLKTKFVDIILSDIAITGGY